jgi:large subunit ribosomal protein L24
MKKEFSKKWKASKNPRKQRKYRYNAPLNIKRKFLSVLLSEELRKKYSIRNIPVRTGDKVKFMRGKFKKRVGKVEKVDVKKTKIFVEGIEYIKKDGSKSLIPINPSNVMIIDLNLDDKKRKKSIERRAKNVK